MILKFTIDQKYDLNFAKGQTAKRRLKKQYFDCKSVLKFTANEYQKSWNKINNEFSQYIKDLTGYQWAHKKYFCIVSPTHQGISNWNGSNKIVRWWLENPYGMRRVTAHELIIHHYFYIIKKEYSDAKLTPVQTWALAEIAAFALTSLTPQAKSFWPWDNSGYYTNHNYQSIVPLQKQLKNAFLQRKNFDDYIQMGIKAVKAYKIKINFC